MLKIKLHLVLAVVLFVSYFVGVFFCLSVLKAYMADMHVVLRALSFLSFIAVYMVLGFINVLHLVGCIDNYINPHQYGKL